MLSLKRYDWVLHMSAIALCSFFLAKAISTSIAGILETMPESTTSPEPARMAVAPPPATEEAKTVQMDEISKVILERNIFNSAESGVVQQIGSDDQVAANLGELGPATKTVLDVKLLGTLAFGEGTDDRSSATISGGKSSKGKAEVYFPNEEKSFAPNVKLTKVLQDRIEFINGGRLEFLELESIATKKSIFASVEEAHGKEESLEKDQSKKTETSEGGSTGNKIVIDQHDVDEALQNLDKLYSEVRIVPNFKGGQADGMKVLSVKPGSIVGKLGIRRGDILQKVNGQDLDIQRGMSLFAEMRDLKNFSLDVVRGGKNQTLEYEIK